ncbi:MAG TPA: DUF1223 domain-containing protein [Thermoanaerobaculia bacterium]|nr:DUF1223 domain-containing protein [Thermoanaerobaculia bacterium]
MRPRIRRALLAAAGLTTIGRVGAVPSSPSAARAVLVELFTSQGCSSCPPADRLLDRLGAEEGASIVPLAFHVDYWNHAGWSDPFSRHAWSSRQEAYVRRFAIPAEYTPEAVVDGSVQLVGSREADLRAAIAAAASRAAADVSLGIERADRKVAVTVHVDRPASLASRRLDLMVALFERDRDTKVAGGENGGHVLHDAYIVRSLDRAAKLKDGPPATEHAISLSVERGWDRLGVAAFLQDPKTLEVFGASAAPVPGAPGSGGVH